MPFSFKFLFLIPRTSKAFAGEKCGFDTPKCVLLPDGRINPNSTVKLATGLICDNKHKLYITRDFNACCQPKGTVIVPDTTTTADPKDTYMLDIVQRLKDANAYLTNCIKTRDAECTTSAIARAAVVVTDAVNALNLLQH